MSFGELFLRHPDLFPERLSGERWGEEALLLDVAGGPYRIEGLAAEQGAALRARFDPLVSEPDAPGPADLQLFRASESDLLPIATAGWEYRLDLEVTGDRLRCAGLDLMGRLEGLPEARGALWTPAADPGRFLGAFENLLRVLVAYRLLARGGVLLHSAGVVASGCAWVLVGRSGAGKTTVSALAAEAGLDVLSDELNLLWVRDGGGVEVESMPFAGDFGQRCRPRVRFPLAGLFQLEKGDREARRPLPLAQGVAALLACAPVVNADPDRRPALLDRIEELARRRPPEMLTFRRTGTPWDILGRP